MLKDKLSSFLFGLMVLALFVAVPGLPGLVAALVTGIPSLFAVMIAIVAGIGLMVRWLYLRSRS
ncbi:MAG: hypothetical protein UW68_C0006G0007 [Candidatus Collierbacteria bacterium GW2011_GWB1_44_6]|uniref:Uncharacterized protein n=2 Tax=Candidatus Collieribacteriota TaxID=1752725 RepID=A0A0G1JQ85_9BACT|nr:MAG: hypothetical protein UV68_C0020G0014 [Candidatus Collierbacteria bacterium GW2011_GWC2_43_12]KKT73565.1 MAG: hypothetical protein UW68_C0006G0007 [Candidatus Collierbacteria bacterium GW2011_GWB1_44_6]KKT83019.1 MAG: hypothetical protein UW80_C0024G0010 [Microgenomates group bacterium GW2011_GWC1_44_9]